MASPAPGVQVGPYKLESRIGAGGMGEVWRARDSRLNRDVAIKFAQERYSERALREARAIAALNHPNIAVLHDVGSNYLVMEYVNGHRLRPGEDIRQTLDIAVQAARGLAAAHAQGIVHRDLKPDNILVTSDGVVKIIDFGLAKKTTIGSEASTVAADLTRPGTVLGTTAYMSPEQARGEDVGTASDQFSFGLILYEFLAGVRPFARGSSAETMAAIIREAAPPLPSSVPPPIRWTVERCLEKDPQRRYESTGDLYRELKKLRECVAELTGTVDRPMQPGPWLRLLPWVAVSVGLMAGAVLFVAAGRSRDWNGNLRFSPISVEAGADHYPSFSPDGRSIAYSHDVDGVGQVFVRTLPQGAPAQITNEDSACQVRCWSHDGRRIYFVRGVRLFAVSAAGGKPQLILDHAVEPVETPDGKSILFTTDVGSPPRIFLSSPPGAPPTPIASMPVESANSFSQIKVSPDGKQLLSAALEGPSLLLDLSTGRIRSLASLTDLISAAWMPDSRHVVVAERRQPRLSLVDTVSGESHTILTSPTALRYPVVSADGKRMVLALGGVDFDLLEIFTDRKASRSLLSTPLSERMVDWAPDGRSFVYAAAQHGLWIRDGDGGNPRRLSDQSNAMSPTFSPDGRRIAFLAGGEIVVTTVDGGAALRLRASTAGGPLCWSPDGEWLVYTTGSTRGGRLMKASASGSGDPVEILSSATNNPTAPCGWTPDGRTIAYRADDGIHAVSPDGRDDRLVVPAQPFRVLTTMSYRVSRSGELLVVHSAGRPITTTLTRYDLRTGARLGVTTLDTSGAAVFEFAVHPDGKRLAIAIPTPRSDLWMLENFPVPAPGWRKLLSHWTAVRP